jgi:RepB DNA-primase from phage plasmid
VRSLLRASQAPEAQALVGTRQEGRGVTGAQEIPQDDARKLQLAMFRGGEGPGALLELRSRRPHGTVRRVGFFDARDVDRIGAEIDRAACSADMWVGAAPRARQDGTANGVSRVWCLWVDVDGGGSLKRLAGFSVQPTMVIRSGSEGCAHAYWSLREPLSPADTQRANRRLALALGADMAATDATRILRPAGSINHKHSPPREVRCTRLELEVFTAMQVVGELPDSDHYRRRAPRAPAISNDPDRALGGLVRVVRNAPEGSRNQILFWAVCRAVEHADIGELSEHQAVEEIRAAAIDAGLPEPEIDATVRSARTQRAPAGAAA